jgi:hypothetical protein
MLCWIKGLIRRVRTRCCPFRRTLCAAGRLTRCGIRFPHHYGCCITPVACCPRQPCSQSTFVDGWVKHAVSQCSPVSAFSSLTFAVGVCISGTPDVASTRRQLCIDRRAGMCSRSDGCEGAVSAWVA